MLSLLPGMYKSNLVSCNFGSKENIAEILAAIFSFLSLLFSLYPRMIGSIFVSILQWSYMVVAELICMMKWIENCGWKMATSLDAKGSKLLLFLVAGACLMIV